MVELHGLFAADYVLAVGSLTLRNTTFNLAHLIREVQAVPQKSPVPTACLAGQIRCV